MLNCVVGAIATILEIKIIEGVYISYVPVIGIVSQNIFIMEISFHFCNSCVPNRTEYKNTKCNIMTCTN